MDKKRFLSLLLALALVAWAGLVGAQPMVVLEPEPLLTLEPNRHVYTLPAGFVPPHVGQEGLDRVEAALDALHYPFYVVYVAQPPAGLNRVTLLGRLARDWHTRQADQFTEEASLFVVLFDPQGKQFLPAARWMRDLGLRGDAPNRPFLDAFSQRARNETDPLGVADGTIALAQALDAQVFDRIDPERQEARRQGVLRMVRERREQRAWNDARGQLIRAIAHADQLTRLLPGLGYPTRGEQAFRRAYEEAAFAVQTGTPSPEVTLERVQEAANRLTYENQAIQRFIDGKRMDAGLSFGLGLALVACVVIGIWLFWRARRDRRERADKLREQIEDALAPLERVVSPFFANVARVDAWPGRHPWLVAATGETKARYDRLINALDAHRSVFAQGQERLADIRTRMEKAGDDPDALFDVLAQADAPFSPLQTETATMDGHPMRQPPPPAVPPPLPASSWVEAREVTKMDLSAQITDLESLTGTQVKALPAEEVPVAWFIQVQDRAHAIGLPSDWPEGLPFVGGPEAAGPVHAELTALQQTDPYGYRQAVTKYRADYDAALASLRTLEGFLIPVFKGAPVDIVIPQDVTVIGPATPQAVLDAAKAAEQHLRTLLTRPTPRDTLKAHADTVLALRGTAEALAVEIRALAKAAPAARRKLQELFDQTQAAQQQVLPRLKGAQAAFPEFAREPFDLAAKRLAQRAWPRFNELLQAFNDGHYAHVIEEEESLRLLLAELAAEFGGTAYQLNELECSRDQLPHTLAHVQGRIPTVTAAVDAARAQVRAAQERHEAPRTADAKLDRAQAALVQAQESLAAATRTGAERRYRSALTTADNAARFLDEAGRCAKEALQACEDFRRPARSAASASRPARASYEVSSASRTTASRGTSSPYGRSRHDEADDEPARPSPVPLYGDHHHHGSGHGSHGVHHGSSFHSSHDDTPAPAPSSGWGSSSSDSSSGSTGSSGWGSDSSSSSSNDSSSPSIGSSDSSGSSGSDGW